MTHGPTPWTLETGVNFPDTPEPETWVAIRDANRVLVYYDCAKEAVDSKEVVELMLANARLFTSAPELLACLKTLVAMDACRYDRDTKDHQQAVAQARAAIAKAEGTASHA